MSFTKPTGPAVPSLAVFRDTPAHCTGSRSCNNEAVEDHPCPYREDINGDHTTQCQCCPSCTHECAMDI